MQINKNNYELFAIDYIDGKLTGDALRQMEGFLAENLDIKAELEGLNLLVLPKEEHIVFEKKWAIIKPEINPVFRWFWPTMSIFVILGAFIFGFLNNPVSENDKVFISTEKTAVSADFKTTDADIHQNIIPTKTTEVATKQKEMTQKIPVRKYTTPTKVKTTGIDKKDSPASDLKKPMLHNSKTDSLKNVLDSLQQLNNKPKIQLNAMPFATVDLHKTIIKTSDLELNTTIIATALSLDFNNHESSEAPAPKLGKVLKTPFGKIKFRDIRDAFLPESYIASTK